MSDKKGFAVTRGKGVRLTFANGYALSVQWGPGNYCENKYGDCSEAGCIQAGNKGSMDAEIAVFDRQGEFINLGCDDVAGWVSADKVAALAARVALATNDKDVKAAIDELEI